MKTSCVSSAIIRKHQTHRKGFTLLEIIIVMTIVFVLVIMVAPSMVKFVGLSKSKSADTVAASIYTITENLIYDDVFLNKLDTYGCKNGCTYVSTDVNKPLVKEIIHEYPDFKGKFQVEYQNSGGLQVKYYYKETTAITTYDGIFPTQAVLGNTPSSLSTFQTKVSNSGPVVTTTTPTVTTASTTTTTKTTTTSPTTTSTPVTTTIKEDNQIPGTDVCGQSWPKREEFINPKDNLLTKSVLLAVGTVYQYEGKFYGVGQNNLDIYPSGGVTPTPTNGGWANHNDGLIVLTGNVYKWDPNAKLPSGSQVGAVVVFVGSGITGAPKKGDLLFDNGIYKVFGVAGSTPNWDIKVNHGNWTKLQTTSCNFS